MEDFTWRVSIKFSGTPKEFNELSAVLQSHQVVVTMPGVVKLKSVRGPAGVPAALHELLPPQLLEKLIAAQPRFTLNFNRDIRGGIRTAHLHLEDDVVLLDRERFKVYVGALATTLAEHRVNLGDDYMEIITDVTSIASLPEPLP